MSGWSREVHFLLQVKGHRGAALMAISMCTQQTWWEGRLPHRQCLLQLWLALAVHTQPQPTSVFLNVGKFPSDILKSSSSRWVTFKVADCADVSWQTGWECVQLEECWGYIFCRVWSVCEHGLSQQSVFSPRQEEIFHANFAILFSFPVYKKWPESREGDNAENCDARGILISQEHLKTKLFSNWVI